MKKILSLIMALTLVMGVNASFKPLNKKAPKNAPRLEQVQKQTPAIRKAPMAATTVTFAVSDFVGKGANNNGNGEKVTVTKNGVTVYTDKGYGHEQNFRVYSGGELTISASTNIAKIEFELNDASKNGGLNATYTPNATTWSFVTSSQARISSIVVTLGEGGETPPTPPTPIGGTIALTALDAFEFGYYGSYSEEGAYNYTLVLYNSQDEENYVPQVGFDIYTEEKDVFTGNFTAEGENLDLDNCAFYPDAESEGEYFSDAKVTIVEGEGDNLVITAEFVTEAGQAYSLSVTGEPYIYDADHPYEPQEAKTFNLTAVGGEADETYFGSDGLVYFFLDMEDGSYVGLTYRTFNSTQPVGTFAISDEEGADTFLTGMDYFGDADGSFYETIDGDVYYFISGSVTLATDEAGNTTINVNATSFYGSTFTVSGVIGAPQPTPGHTIVMADYADVNFTTMDGVYTIATDKNGGASDPVYNDNGEDLRLYATNIMTLTKNTKNGPMTKIVFNISTAGLKRQAEITPSVGKMAYDMANATVTWTGEASEVTFTVGEKNVYGSDGKTKAGQFDFTSMDIEPNDYSALVNIKAVKAVKTLVNGQVIIERNGVRYNALGTKF